jgi:predicted carbohydrate-binding protein with CBM5 and CBM33 domain
MKLAFVAFLIRLIKVTGHGIVEEPPARNWICGQIAVPDNTDKYPECDIAFQFADGGYQSMSVLTHDWGRSSVSPLPKNVCGFDSETWLGKETPWDAPMDWPASPRAPGRNEFIWNIMWGPHFDDTKEFKYWITKSHFQFDPSTALSWNDFEDEPFCVQFYNPNNPQGNPDVIPLQQAYTFRTFCEIPEREGRHVVYAEWGRDESTLERFHGCIDLEIGTTTNVEKAPGPSPTSGVSTGVAKDGPAQTTVPKETPAAPLAVTPSESPVTIPTSTSNDCVVNVREDANVWHVGVDIGFDAKTVTLDFSNTDLDLSLVTKWSNDGLFDPFSIQGQTITLTNPGWVSAQGSFGYLGISGNEVAAFSSLGSNPPTCVVPGTGRTRNLRQKSRRG